MKIRKEVLCQINEFSPEHPPEIGGILGSREKGVVTDVVFDRSQASGNKMCYYAPNVDYLNQRIKEWSDSGVQFSGVFHIHFAGVPSLSEADRKYIYEIMHCMPSEIKQLYFPVFVMPERELICYIADRTKIYNDTLYLIESR